MAKGDYMKFVANYRRLQENQHKTYNQCMMDAKESWADPSIQGEFIKSLVRAPAKPVEAEPEKKPVKKVAKKAVVEEEEEEEEVVQPKKVVKKRVIPQKPLPVSSALVKDKEYYKDKYKKKYRGD